MVSLSSACHSLDMFSSNELHISCIKVLRKRGSDSGLALCFSCHPCECLPLVDTFDPDVRFLTWVLTVCPKSRAATRARRLPPSCLPLQGQLPMYARKGRCMSRTSPFQERHLPPVPLSQRRGHTWHAWPASHGPPPAEQRAGRTQRYRRKGVTKCVGRLGSQCMLPWRDPN